MKQHKVARRFKQHSNAFVNVERLVGPLPDSHRAITNSTTMYPSTVVTPQASKRLLISGVNNLKLGDRVVKGPWKGGKLFSLSLVERETCPTHCHHWNDCYGNAMPFARRHKNDRSLVPRLWHELCYLTSTHEKVIVRIHVLGDFYSSEYVRAWMRFLTDLPNLYIFGYTAWRPWDVIGISIERMMRTFPDRCVIRWSSDHWQELGAITITKPTGLRNTVVCPAQTEKTECCGTCGLCWSPSFKHGCIAFIAHGRIKRT